MKKNIVNTFFFLSLLLANSVFAVELTLLVVYNQDFENARNPQTTIQSYVNAANNAYSISGMNVSLRVIHSQKVDFLGDQVGGYALKEMGDPTGLGIHNYRPMWDLQDLHRPDITVFIGNATSTLCGMAMFPYYVGQPLEKLIRNNPRTRREVIEQRYYDAHTSFFRAAATVGWQAGCGAPTFIHEIGHVLGAGHGEVRQENDVLFGLFTGTDRFHPGVPIETAVGHGYFNLYRTVMTYPDVFGSAPLVNYISNPLVFFNSMPTGTNNRNAAAGMIRIAVDKVQHNQSCYPTVRKTDGKKRTVTRRCSN